MTSGGLAAAHLQLVPVVEPIVGRSIITTFGASMGPAPDTIPTRLQRGEHADVLLMVGPALKLLSEQGRVRPYSIVDLAQSTIAMAVRHGSPKPDIGSVDAFIRAMRSADSIAYSASASGRYVAGELFPRLGLAQEIASKSRKVLSERVGAVIARGEAQLGFQQYSELLPIVGIDIVGPLPQPLQHVTTYGAGISSNAIDPEAAATVIEHLASPAGAAIIAGCGLQPIQAPAPS